MDYRAEMMANGEDLEYRDGPPNGCLDCIRLNNANETHIRTCSVCSPFRKAICSFARPFGMRNVPEDKLVRRNLYTKVSTVDGKQECFVHIFRPAEQWLAIDAYRAERDGKSCCSPLTTCAACCP